MKEMMEQMMRQIMMEQQAKQVNEPSDFHDLLKQLRCTDAGCAKMLSEVDNILFVGGSAITGYIFDKENIVWEYCKEPQLIIRETGFELCRIATEKLEALQKLPEYRNLSKKEIVQIEKNILNLESSRKIIAVLKQVSVVDDSRFDTLLNKYLPVKGGNFNLQTGSFDKRKKEDYFTFCLDVELVDDTKRAEDFVKLYCPDNDEDTYQHMLDVLSYGITPWNFLKMFCLFYGIPNSGKSKLIQAVSEFLGKRLSTAVTHSFFRAAKKAQAGAPTPEITQAVGVHLATFGDAQPGMLDNETIKIMTGNDKISYRPLFQESRQTTLVCKLYINTNHILAWKPEEAMDIRVHVLTFENVFVEHEPTKATEKKKNKQIDIMMKDTNFKNQMFSLLARNCPKLWKAQQLTHSDYIEKHKKIYLTKVDNVNTFF